MQVWLVQAGWDYEGKSVQSVHATYEAAYNAATLLQMPEVEYENGHRYESYRYDSIAVARWEVDGECEDRDVHRWHRPELQRYHGDGYDPDDV